MTRGACKRLDEYLNVEADQPRVTHRSLATGFDRRFRLIGTVTAYIVKASPATRLQRLISTDTAIYLTL
jgi:hypothetical protein